jgi:hypothetical protein
MRLMSEAAAVDLSGETRVQTPPYPSFIQSEKLTTILISPFMADYNHKDFEVLRTDNRYGGFEVLRPKDGNTVRISFASYM